ncbi:hypothetical protein [Gimesia maris]|uniref:hypothetical protein n=1 Tax=Gimesia maris TaxID=122 RepID=UPI0032ED03F0
MKSIDHNSLLPQNDKRRNHFRKGAVVIIPLVCLILTLAIIGELLKQTSIELNQLKKSQHNLQAIWLSEAAVQRTVNRLKEDLTYSGETWQISSQEIGGPYPGEVVIEIDRALIQDQSIILIRTKASYPAKAIERVRVIREWPVQLSNTAIENNSPSQ